jgi:ComEC/Rec2-related protein
LKLYTVVWLKRIRKSFDKLCDVYIFQVCSGIFLAACVFFIRFELALSIGLLLVVFGKFRLTWFWFVFVVCSIYFFARGLVPAAVPDFSKDFLVVDRFSSGAYSQLVIVGQGSKRFLADIGKYPPVVPGDVVAFNKATYELVENNYTDYFLGYLYSVRIEIIVSSQEHLLIDGCVGFSGVGCEIESRLRKLLSYRTSGLVTGMLVGRDDLIPREVTDQFRLLGLSHVIAVSGFNVSILAIVSISLFRILRLNRFLGIILAIPLLLVFLAIVGFHNLPAFRATIMGILVLLSVLAGKPGGFISSLMVGVALIIILDPIVVTNVSFQLSLTALIGVYVFTSRYASLLDFLPKMIKDILSTTMAATLATLPISISAFGGMSTLGLVANLIFLPFVPVIMLIGTVGVVVSVVSIEVAKVLMLPLQKLLEVLFLLIGEGASFSFAYTESRIALVFSLLFFIIALIWGDYRLVKDCYT